MIFNSIRWRVQAWHGLILILVLAGFGFTAYQVARESQLRRMDQDLDVRLMSLFRPPPPGRPPTRGGPSSAPGGLDSTRVERRGPAPEGNLELPPGPRSGWSPGEGRPDSREFFARIRDTVQQAAMLDAGQTNAYSSYYYVVWQEDGSLATRSPEAPSDVPPPDERVALPAAGASQARDVSGEPSTARPGPPRPAIARTRGEYRERYQLLPHGECVLVGRSMAPELAAMRRLGLGLAVAGVAVLGLGLAGGWWLATRAIRPIEDITATAMKIAAGDLSQRINAADTDSELGRVAGVLNSTFARLEAAFAHQARFTSDASHELRTPVSVIISQTQTVLARERPGEEYREALEACQRAAQRMRALTESMLELARLDAGQEPMKHERFDLAKVARDCVELVRPLADQRGLKIECDLRAVECVGDAERIGQVAVNLLANAIQFNRDQGAVRISVDADNRRVFLKVADTGEGIGAEDLPHIFERFYRVDESRSGGQGRTGLGLAICKAIVDAHGGSIEVSSREGVGSIFTVTLPMN